jgi:uncharacterized protein (DUF58 family)
MSTAERNATAPLSGRINQGIVVLAASTVLLVAAGVVLGSFPFLSGAAVLASMYAVANLMRGPSGISVERIIQKDSVWVGDEVEVVLKLTVKKGIGPVFVRCPIPQVMELVDGSNLFGVWKGYNSKTINLNFKIRTTVRGVFTFEPVRWEAHHAFRFRTPLHETTGTPEDIIVRAGINEISRVTNVRGLAVNPNPMMDMSVIGNQTTEFREIRSFTSGDSVKSINWRATARKSSGRELTSKDILVNDYEREGKKAIWLFLDTTSAMSVGSSLVNPLEHAIEAAGALSFYYLKRGYEVGAHFSNRSSRLIHPDSGQAQLRKISRELSELSDEKGKYDFRRSVQICRRQILRYVPECFLITRLDTDEPVQSNKIPPGLDSLVSGVKALAAYGSRGHKSVRVNIVAIAGYAYTAQNEEGHSVARLIRSLETDLISRTVRRYGVNVISWDPMRNRFSDLLLSHALNGRGRR